MFSLSHYSYLQFLDVNGRLVSDAAMLFINIWVIYRDSMRDLTIIHMRHLWREFSFKLSS